jgi:hypothetical protein
MKLKALRNILVGGQHFDEGCTFETDHDTAAKLLMNGRAEVAPEQTKQPMADEIPAAPVKKAKR